MGGLPWYRQWTEFSGHTRTRELCGRLRDHNAGMYLVRLQEHCAQHAHDGRIPVHAVEVAAEWRGKEGVLLAALEAVGSLDVDGDVRVLHGWVERNGAVIRKWLDDNGKPHGKRRKPTVNPDATPYGVSTGFDPGLRRVDVDLERSGSQPPVVPQAEPPARWRPLLAAMTPEQHAEHAAERTRCLAAIEASGAWTSQQNIARFDLDERLFAEWSARLAPARAEVG